MQAVVVAEDGMWVRLVQQLTAVVVVLFNLLMRPLAQIIAVVAVVVVLAQETAMQPQVAAA
jgi:hypothetical protein